MQSQFKNLVPMASDCFIDFFSSAPEDDIEDVIKLKNFAIYDWVEN